MAEAFGQDRLGRGSMKTSRTIIAISALLPVILLVACSMANIYSVTPTPTVRVTEPTVSIEGPTPTWGPATQTTVTEKPTQTTQSLPTQLDVTPTPTLTEPMISNKSVPDSLREYIGMEFPPLPDTFSSGFGQGLPPDTAYSGHEFAINIANDGTNNLLLFSKLNSRDKQDKAYWVVVDILILPKLQSAERFLSDGCKTGQGTEVNHEILAIIAFDKEVETSRYVTNNKVLRAWRVNRSVEAIEEIPTDDIECFADFAMKY